MVSQSMNFIVLEKRTGMKICECGSLSDAMMMVDLDPQRREARRNCRVQPETVNVRSVRLPDDLRLSPQLILEESDLQQIIV
jgi:hypothetical protein